MNKKIVQDLMAYGSVQIALQIFYDEVNRRAEERMLETGHLEGSHKAALDATYKEWWQLTTDQPKMKVTP